MIDPQTKKDIIELYKSGLSKTVIKERVGVSRPTITTILREAGVSKADRQSISISEDFDKPRREIKEKGDFQISRAQISRLQGMSHLEGGKSISSILDRLINSDATLKKLEKENVQLRTENLVLMNMPSMIYLRKKGLSDYVVNQAKINGYDDIIEFINEYVKGYFTVLDGWQRADTAFHELVERYKNDIQGPTPQRKTIRYEL